MHLGLAPVSNSRLPSHDVLRYSQVCLNLIVTLFHDECAVLCFGLKTATKGGEDCRACTW